MKADRDQIIEQIGRDADMGSQNGLVSVIMPAYNCEKFIEQAVNSVLMQTYSNLELVVIDDGSKDNTAKIVDGLSKSDLRIKLYINNENMGVSAARNRGISLASGDWIAFLDSDDIWEKTKVEKQIIYANEMNAQFLFTSVSYINENGEHYNGIFEVPDRVTYKQLLKQNVIACSSVLIKKYFFNTIKMERDEMHEDYAAWLRVLKTGVCAYGINEPLLTYRISRNSKSGRKIRTIKMTYSVYRFVGVNPIESAYFMMSHILRSVKKYRNINIATR